MDEAKREKKKDNLDSVLGVFVLFMIARFLMNWSLLIGENLMKWDIWSAEYPSQMLMSEAIANHTLPLWNPLMRYGTPNYSVLWNTGMVCDYSDSGMDWLYTGRRSQSAMLLHVAIGGFGMYLLTGQELKNKKELSKRGILHWSSGRFALLRKWDFFI